MARNQLHIPAYHLCFGSAKAHCVDWSCLLQSVREQIKRMAIGGEGNKDDFYAVSSSESSSSSGEGSQDSASLSYSG